MDIPSPNILVAGVGGVPLNGGIKNTLNWAPRVGVTYQLNEKTVIRGGYGRSYDIGVFGSLFGHTVTQNLPVLSAQDLSGANSFDAVFNLVAAGAGAGVPDAVPPNGQLLAAERRLHARAARQAAAADGRRLQRHRPA